MATKHIDLASLAERVVQMVATSKVNLAKRTKGRDRLIDEIRLAIKGAPPLSQRDALVPRPNTGLALTNSMIGPNGVVQMTAAESQRADQERGYGG